MGIAVKPLLESRIFRFDFDYDEWPGNHNNEETLLRPYNESLYSIRRHYRTVFPEDEFEDIINEDGSQKDNVESDKIFKIKYSINLLPFIGSHMQSIVNEDGQVEDVMINEEVKFMDACQNIEQDHLDMFDSLSLQEVIDFKWQEYGYTFHLIGCLIHFSQVGMLIYYVNYAYIQNSTYDYEKGVYNKNTIALALLVGLLYPSLYESY